MKKSSTLFFAVFLCGVISANVLGIASGREFGAINEYFINRYLYADICGRELFLYLFYERVPKFFLLLFLSIGIYGTWIINGYICYLGFSTGFLAVITIMNYGIKGVLLMMGFFLPQWIFYVPVIAIWYLGLERYKGIRTECVSVERRGNDPIRYLILFVIGAVLFLLGIFMESYVNPFLLQKISRVLK